MYAATLIANPKSANLTAEIVTETATKLGVQDIDWLNENVACDIFLPNERHPVELDVIRDALRQNEIDFVVQPIEGRRKKVLLADMDSTMIQQECIDELAAEAGVGEHVAGITARAMNGELDFEDALRERVGLLKGLDVSVIQKVIASRITLMPGGAELLATMKANDAYAALVSGGFTDFTQAIADKLGFDENRANTLLQSDGILTGEVGTPILGREAKVEALEDIIDQKGLTTDDVIAVGDGANDLGMLGRAGTGVALHAKPVVAEQSGVQLNFADLTGLLYLQGYRISEFAA
ncbi:phosphoserine phosphatase SerB [Amylibacter sp. SFDW26]|uniref:phosphoserine phosphatase SerB n=1 Tax=Amylibacter sp. SFDW26 TaxID=2652722 RepID=UPI00126288A5|nr:phosphoserine phosphatase SerB [Amylibacter sp. SFDW26]KAB7614692.1 phosphoserine phosphatase SerB [Amylibacter sp. SFDW26]